MCDECYCLVSKGLSFSSRLHGNLQLWCLYFQVIAGCILSAIKDLFSVKYILVQWDVLQQIFPTQPTRGVYVTWCFASRVFALFILHLCELITDRPMQPRITCVNHSACPDPISYMRDYMTRPCFAAHCALLHYVAGSCWLNQPLSSGNIWDTLPMLFP